MSDIEQVRAALEEIGKGIDLIDFSGPAANQNIAAATKVVWPELKRALAALTRMEKAMTDPAIIKAAEREYGRQLSVINVAAQTLQDAADLSAFWDDEVETRRVAQAVLAAVTPLIRAAALEEAAKVAMDHVGGSYQVAAAIRALKSAAPSPSSDSA